MKVAHQREAKISRDTARRGRQARVIACKMRLFRDRRAVLGLGLSVAMAVGAVAAMAACTGLEPAAVGAGASVVQTGVTFFEKGKVGVFEKAPYPMTLEIVRRTGTGLALMCMADESTPTRTRIVYHDERKNSIVVIVQRHTEEITYVQADVGTFGETGLASLFVKQVLAGMAAANPEVRVPAARDERVPQGPTPSP